MFAAVSQQYTQQLSSKDTLEQTQMWKKGSQKQM